MLLSLSLLNNYTFLINSRFHNPDGDSDGCDSFLNPSIPSKTCKCDLELKVLDLNERLEKVLEELRFFRSTAEKMSSFESSEKVQEKLSSFDLDPCLDIRKGEVEEIIRPVLGWEELCGISDSWSWCDGQNLSPENSAPMLSDNTVLREEDDDVASLLSDGAGVAGAAGALIAPHDESSANTFEHGEEGTVTCGIQFSNFPAQKEFTCLQLNCVGHLDKQLTPSWACGKETICDPYTEMDLVCDPGVKKQKSTDVGHMDTRGVFCLEVGRCTPISVHPHVSREEAFVMLCRGSVLEKTFGKFHKEEVRYFGSMYGVKSSHMDFDEDLNKLEEEVVVCNEVEEEALALKEDLENGSKEDSWLSFIGDNFESYGGCLRPHWERCEKNEIIGALVDVEGVSSTEDEEEETC